MNSTLEARSMNDLKLSQNMRKTPSKVQKTVYTSLPFASETINKTSVKNKTNTFDGKQQKFMALILKNFKQRFNGSSSFISQSKRSSLINSKSRTRKNVLQLHWPDSLNYEDVDINYKEPKTFYIGRTEGRDDHLEHENKEEYKNHLEFGDYSSIKVKDLPNFDIGKIEERDDVSFYAPLAR